MNGGCVSVRMSEQSSYPESEYGEIDLQEEERRTVPLFFFSGLWSPALPLTCKCLDSRVSSVSHRINSPGIFWGRVESVSLD